MASVIRSATPFGPLKRMDFANGTRQILGYDARYQVESNQLMDTITSMKLADYGYETDPAGNIERIDDLADSSYSRQFGYDDLNRLTSAHTGAALWVTGEYKWDAMGNILSLKLGESPQGGDDGLFRRRGIRGDENRPLGRSSSFVYSGTTPVLAEVATNHLARPVVHDAAGNETRHIVNREYSARNLLSIVREGAEPGDPSNHRVSYRYDGRGVRVSRLEVPVEHEFGAQRHYVYSPELSILSATRDSAANWWDGSSDPVPGQPFHYEIVWFGTRPVARVTGGTTRFTFADHLGTPIMQTDAVRSVTWRAEYEPFGNIYEMRVGSRSDQPLRFPGQEAAMNWEGQEENYNIFRWYRSGWGRYTQADPSGLWGDPHPYLYAGGNPLRFTDPSGLLSIERHVSYIHEPWRDHFFVRSGSTRPGLEAYFNCDCQGGQWRLRFTIIVRATVRYANDDVRRHEQRHVETFYRDVLDWAEFFYPYEHARYASREICERVGERARSERRGLPFNFERNQRPIDWYIFY